LSSLPPPSNPPGFPLLHLTMALLSNNLPQLLDATQILLISAV
jgi:hypothetical protein